MPTLFDFLLKKLLSRKSYHQKSALFYLFFHKALATAKVPSFFSPFIVPIALFSNVCFLLIVLKSVSMHSSSS
jgi:hypothetical protein